MFIGVGVRVVSGNKRAEERGSSAPLFFFTSFSRLEEEGTRNYTNLYDPLCA